MDVARHDPGILGRGLQQVGRAVAGIGAEMSQYAAREQQRLDAVKADEAKNALRQGVIELTAGQGTPGDESTAGYAVRIRGAKAVRPNDKGESHLDDYGNRFVALRDETARKLALSGRALEDYNAFAGTAFTNFQAGLLNHTMREADQHYAQTYEATVKSEALTASASWNDPQTVVESMRRAGDAAAREAERLGRDAPAAQQLAIGAVVEATVDGALRDGDAQFAEEHLNNFKSTLPPDVALALHGKVQTVQTRRLSLDVAEAVGTRMAPLVAPSELDRGAHIVGAAPGSDERVYFDDLLQRHGGDLSKTMAAYIAGPKVVAEAEKLAGKTVRAHAKDPAVKAQAWTDFVPKETAAKVREARKAFAAGAAPAEPTVAEVHAAAEQELLRIKPDATPEQLDAARGKAEQWFNDQRTARKQTETTTLDQVKMSVDLGKVRNYRDIQPQDLAMMGQSGREAIRRYIDGTEGDQDKIVQASPAAREQYDRLMASPDILKDFDAATIMSLTPELGKKWVDDLLRRKQDYMTNPEKFTAAKVDADLFNTAIEPYLKGVSKSGASLFKAQVRDKVEVEIGAMRAQGKVPTDKEKRDIVGKYAMRYPIEKPGVLWGTNVARVPGAVLPSVEQVPLAPDEVAKIRAKAAKLGMQNLSDSDILRVYRMQQAAEAAK